MEFIKREIKSPKLTFKLEVELNNSSLTPEEATDRLDYLINRSYNAKAVSEFVLFLIRETKSSTYEIKNLEII